MKRKTDRRWERGGKRERVNEGKRQRERRRSRETDGWIIAFTSESCLFAKKAATHFPPSPHFCHSLVISQHKILRIKSRTRGCSQTLLNLGPSGQTLNKCLIKPQQVMRVVITQEFGEKYVCIYLYMCLIFNPAGACYYLPPAPTEKVRFYSSGMNWRLFVCLC